MDPERHVLIALMPSFGPDARRAATTGILKLGRGQEIVVESSTVAFLDDGGNTVGELPDAFGLSPGTRLTGPSYARLRDERPRPETATSMRWALDDLSSPVVVVIDPVPEVEQLTLSCLPLHVPVRDDRQLFIQFVNPDDQPVDLVAAVRTATLWVDGRAHPSTTGGHWDGRSHVRARGTSRHGFRVGDFDGAPVLGDHEIALEMFGRRTRALAVRLVGEPWTRPAAEHD